MKSRRTAVRSDLHTHTVASDGLLTVSELLAEARRVGLEVLAITDHDSLESLGEGEIAASKGGPAFIPGIELNAETAECEVHVLGYFLPPICPLLEEFLGDIRQKRAVRTVQIIEKLATLDVRIDYARVRQLARGKTLGRPHIAMAMVEKGYVSSIQEAFNRYLGRDAPGHVPRYRFDPVTAVQMIRRAGGVPVLAHPSFVTSVDAILPSLMEAGLRGLEVYYPGHTPLQTRHYKDLASRHGLLVTGGSDYHGPSYREGSFLGAMSMTADEIRALYAARDAQGGGDGA